MFTPETEARVRTAFASTLATPEGRFAELAVLAELIQTTTRGDNLDAAASLRDRSRQLLRIGKGPGSRLPAPANSPRQQFGESYYSLPLHSRSPKIN